MSSPLLRQLHRDFAGLLPDSGELVAGLPNAAPDTPTTTEFTAAESPESDLQAALQLVQAEAPRSLTGRIFSPTSAPEISPSDSPAEAQALPSLRESFDRNLHAFLSRRISDPEAAARLLPALVEAAETIRDRPSQENWAELVTDLSRLRRFYQGGIAFYEDRRLHEGDGFVCTELVEFRRNLRNIEAALDQTRAYLRSNLAAAEISESATALSQAQGAAQISLELGHHAGLTLDLKNWESQLSAAAASGAVSSQVLIENYTGLIRGWSAVRNAHSRQLGVSDDHVPIPLSDAQIETRLRNLAETLIEMVQIEYDFAERVTYFDTRLNQAIDQVDANFLAALSGEGIGAFLQMAEYADTLRDNIGEAPSPENFLRQLQAATLYGSLGLGDEVRRVLSDAENYVATLALESERISGLMNLAQIYQGAGQREHCTRLLNTVATRGQASSEAALQDTGTLARAMAQLNEGELTVAAATLESIAHDPRAQALLAPLTQGQRSQRQAQVYALWQGALQDYLSGLRAEEMPQVDRIERELSSALALAHAQVISGQAEDMPTALRQMGSGEVQSYLLSDHTHAHYLERLSDLDLSDAGFAREVLAAAEDYLRSERYQTAAAFAQFVRDDSQVGNQARNLLSDLPDQVMIDATWTALGNMSILFAESEAEAIRSGVIIIATFGLASWLGIEAEVFYQGTQISTRLAAAGYVATDQMIGWGVSSATNAAVFTAGGFATDAAFGHTEHLTVGNFFREFGAMLVTFGMFRGVTSGMRRFTQPVQQQLAQAERVLAQAERTGVGVEAATQRLQGAQWAARRMALISWGTRVVALTGSGYLNEGIGLHDSSGASIGPRLFSSAVMDAQMMLAHRAANGLSGGRLDRLQEHTHARYAERAVSAARPRIQEILENLEQNAIVDRADPMANYVQAALEQSAALTGNARVGEVLATRQGRRALFAAIDALGLDPGSRAYEMVATAVILNTLPAAPTRAQFLRAMAQARGRLGENAAPIHRLSAQMTESLRQSAQAEGVELSPEQIAQYQDRCTGQLAERILRNQMGAAELTEIHQGLSDGTVELVMQLDFHTGQFHWDFQHTPVRVEASEASAQRSLMAENAQANTTSPEVSAAPIRPETVAIVPQAETTPTEAPLAPVMDLTPRIPRNIPVPIRNMARSAAAVVGLGTGLSLLDVNLAHAAHEMVTTASVGGTTTAWIVGGLGLGALAMAQMGDANGSNLRDGPQSNSGASAEVFARLSSRLMEIAAQIPQARGLPNLFPQAVRTAAGRFRDGIPAADETSSPPAHSLETLHRDLRHFQGSSEQTAALSAAFRAIALPSLLLPTEAMAEFIHNATRDPERAFLEIFSRAFPQLADAFADLPEHRPPLTIAELQDIIDILRVYSSLTRNGQEAQVHEILQTLSQLRDLLPSEHLERHLVEDLIQTLQGISEELPLFDPRPLAYSIVASPLLSTSILMASGSEISTPVNLALAGGLSLFSYASINSAFLIRDLRRYGAPLALNHLYDNLSYFRDLVFSPRLLLQVLHRPTNHEGHFADVDFVTRQRINAILNRFEKPSDDSVGSGTALTTLLGMGTGLATLFGAEVAHAATDTISSVGTIAPSAIDSGTLGLFTGLGLMAVGGIFTWTKQGLRRLFSSAPAENEPSNPDTPGTDAGDLRVMARYSPTEIEQFITDLANPDGFAVLESLIRVGDVFPDIPEEDRLRVMLAAVRVMRRPELHLRRRAEQVLRNNLHFVSEYQASYYALNFLSEIDFSQDLELSLAAGRLLQHALMAMGRTRMPQINEISEARWGVSILTFVQQVETFVEARSEIDANAALGSAEQTGFLRQMKRYLRKLRIPELRQALLAALPANFADSYEELQSFAQHQGREDETVPVAEGIPQVIAPIAATLPDAPGMTPAGVEVELELRGDAEAFMESRRGTLVPGHLDSTEGGPTHHFLVGRVFRSGYREWVELIPMANGIAIEGAPPICLLVAIHSAGQLAVGQAVSFIPGATDDGGSNPPPADSAPGGAALMVGLGLGLTALFPPEIAHAASQMVQSSESGGLAATLLGVFGVSVFAMATTGSGPYRGDGHDSAELTHLLSRIQAIQELMRLPDTLSELSPQGVQAAVLGLGERTVGLPQGQSVSDALAELHGELRHFRGTTEEVALLSAALRRIAFFTLLLPPTSSPAKTDTPEVPPPSYSDISTSTTQNPRMVMENMREHPRIREIMEMAQTQRIIDPKALQEFQVFLQASGQWMLPYLEEQIGETLMTLAHLREALPEHHTERRAIESTMAQLQNFNEEWQLFDSRGAAAARIATLVEVGLLWDFLGGFNSPSDLLMIGGLALGNFSLAQVMPMVRLVTRLGWSGALNQVYNHLSQLKQQILNPRNPIAALTDLPRWWLEGHLKLLGTALPRLRYGIETLLSRLTPGLPTETEATSTILAADLEEEADASPRVAPPRVRVELIDAEDADGDLAEIVVEVPAHNDSTGQHEQED